MNLLKAISLHSNYRPLGGDLLKLFQLSIVEEVGQAEVVSAFKSQGYYRHLKADLKNRLLDGIFLSSFKELTAIQHTHFKIQKRNLESKMLIQSDQRIAGVTIAEETVANAEKYGLVEIVYTLSRDLEIIYAVNKNETRKYQKYKRKVAIYLKYLRQETTAQSLFAELAHCIQRKKDTSHILAAIEVLRSWTFENSQYKFRFYYYSVRNLYARLHNDHAQIIKICKEAAAFFSQSTTILPYTTEWSFRFQMLPVYLTQKAYGDAAVCIKKILHLPSKGSYNWHLTLLYKAVLGFYSNRRGVVIQAYNEAESIKKKLSAEVIYERWKIVGAYLALFGKAGQLHFPAEFRTYRFVNDTKPNGTAKINMRILELLHLLLDDKRKVYMNRVETIEQYISTNCKGKPRAKYFLRMLRAVEDGDYNALRVEAHAKKHQDLLKRTASTININVLDSEPVPYPILWDLVMDHLRP